LGGMVLRSRAMAVAADVTPSYDAIGQDGDESGTGGR
jgi:hypothetical protein